MPSTTDLNYIHTFVPAPSGSSRPVTLLLLHGTGGDENSLLSLGNNLWPGAALLGLRGKVLENDMPPSFRRFTEVGIGDVRSRTEELAQFIRAASERYRVQYEKTDCRWLFQWCKPRSELDSASSALPCRCGSFPSDRTAGSQIIRDFSNLSIFIGAATVDPLIPTGQAGELAAIFKSGGADVAISWHQGGRELGEDDIRPQEIGLFETGFEKDWRHRSRGPVTA